MRVYVEFGKLCKKTHLCKIHLKDDETERIEEIECDGNIKDIFGNIIAETLRLIGIQPFTQEIHTNKSYRIPLAVKNALSSHNCVLVLSDTMPEYVSNGNSLSVEAKSVVKYVLTDEVIKHKGKMLHRIKHFRSGKLGGFVESEHNLSQLGKCWIGDDAKVFGNAKVVDNAIVSGESSVFGDAVIKDNAKVMDGSMVFGKAVVKDNAMVMMYPQIYGESIVSGVVNGYAEVCGRSIINGRVGYDEYIFNSVK